ncbi:MAG: hypothetical protein OXT09_22545 [Myxococcales bacterium]|nr:hypothetical protein [Myxococcales bacterium]
MTRLIVMAAERPRSLVASLSTACVKFFHVAESGATEAVAESAEAQRIASAVCAHHPEKRASITCPHCGSYACGECTVDTLWGDVMCEDCMSHGRAQYPLPWEQSVSPISFVQSAYLLFAEAPHAFRHFPEGRVLRALGFALQVGLLLGLLSGTTRWLFAPRHWAADAPAAWKVMGAALLEVVPSTLAFVLVTTLVFHGTATLLRGRTSFRVSLRAACYVSVVQLLEVANIVVDTILAGSAYVTAIIRLFAVFFLVWGLSLVAQHRFRLSRPRAIAAGAAPALLLIVLFVALLVTLTWLRPAG